VSHGFASGYALLYDLVMGAAERAALARWRRRVVGGAHGRVLEIGAGTGLNFAYYALDADVVATEPDPGMLDRAAVRADAVTARVTLVAADAEVLPFPDDVFDAAVVSLTLCTIPRPEKALAELRRVLRPGATLRLLEHVRVEQPAVARVQAWLTPAWRRLAGGCHLDRPTVQLLSAHGFEVRAVLRHARGLVVEVEATRAESSFTAKHDGSVRRRLIEPER
jgi:ubiquinone/menaquinone biosynthesis C-methylase UbiE